MPSRVGRYLVFDEFARGGMASVFLGRLDGSAGFKRIVAVKRLSAEAASDAATRLSIQDEALITSRIIHRNVVQVFDVVEAEGALHLVMEYVHGLSLSMLLQAARGQGKPVPAQVAAAIIADALDGLQAAHEATDAEGKPLGIVHRDMSPQNILVGADGVSRVLDFGIAKSRWRGDRTAPGVLRGKLLYMAPEQIHGNTTPTSDVFSTALVLYEALAGRPAYGVFESEGEALGAILLGKIDSLAALRPELPGALTRIMDRALQVEPAKRFASARQLSEALRTWGATTPEVVARWANGFAEDTLARRKELVRRVEASDEGAAGKRSARLRGVALGAGVAGVLGVGAWLAWMHWGREKPPPPPLVAQPAAPTPSPPPTAPAPPPAVAAPAPEPVTPPPRPPVRRTASNNAHAASKRGKAGGKDCDPPYRIDDNGHKQYKPECF